jgi:hypothetical protein
MLYFLYNNRKRIFYISLFSFIGLLVFYFMPGDFLKSIEPEWAAISISILIGLAGIFRIDQWVFKAKLKISIKLEPPDCHKIDIKTITGWRQGVYYLRFRIINTGNKEAKNVQVFLKDVMIFNDLSLKYEDNEDFLPLNLKWAHIGGHIMGTIPSKLFKHCDFGYLCDSDQKHRLLDTFNLEDDSNIILKLDTIVDPNTGSNIIKPGKYKIVVFVSAEDVKTIKKEFIFELRDAWSEDQGEMFLEYIKIN